MCGIRHDIVGYNRIKYSVSDEILKPQHCMLYVVMALFAAWIADAGAYFVGSFIET
ncbi:MAG: hypothetical protein ACLSCV_04750 [Acutalibacteraceae bacterium]